MKVAMAPLPGPATAPTASCRSRTPSTIRYSPGTTILLAPAHRRENGDLLAARDRLVLPGVDPIAGEHRALLAQRRNLGPHSGPDVGERRVRRHLHLDRAGACGLAVAGEEHDREPHGAAPGARPAGDASRRLSRTSASTWPTMASIPAFTSARRVNAVEAGVWTMPRSRSIVRVWGSVGGAGTSIGSPRTVRTGISPRLAQPIGFLASRKWRRNSATSGRTARGSPRRANAVEKLTTGPYPPGMRSASNSSCLASLSLRIGRRARRADPCSTLRVSGTSSPLR